MTITPYWYTAPEIYNANFDYRGILFGAFIMIAVFIIVLPFILGLVIDDN